MSKNKKIGVGIITCNRKTFLHNLITSLQSSDFDNLVIVNDGDVLETDQLPSIDKKYNLINNGKNIGVSKSKNKAFKALLEKDCDYIFLIEDDMLIKNKNVFNRYIEVSEHTGIQHMMFGYHGPANKGNISKGAPQPRKIIDYSNDIKIALNRHCVGSFCFYTKECLESVGLNDEEFDKNNFEHVEHSYRLAKAGYSTPYWWWTDLSNSFDYIDEQACSEENTSIHRGSNWQENIKQSALLFQKKHGYLPAWQNCVPDVPFDDVKLTLKNISKNKTLSNSNRNTFDVIILSLAVDEHSFNITKTCVESYIKTADNIINNIFVVETNKEANWDYKQPKVTVIKPNEKEFNYNKYYNIALAKCTSEFVIGPNNDVIIQPNCIQNLLKIFQTNINISSLSPVDRTWSRHSVEAFPKDNSLYCGYEVSKHLMGCCFACRRSIFTQIGFLDETFYFFYQDNDYALSLQRCNILHALYTGAHIKHGLSQTDKYAESKFKYTEENMHKQLLLFKQKWNSAPYNSNGYKPYKEYKYL